MVHIRTKYFQYQPASRMIDGDHTGHFDSFVQFEHILIVILVASFAGALLRLSVCLPMYRRKNEKWQSECVRTLVVFGSGGHTAEMLKLIEKINPSKFRPMHVVMSTSDRTSRGKIETSITPCLTNAQWHSIYRSREVKQSWGSTILTTMLSMCQSMLLIARVRPELVVCNGPGTCVPLCACVFFLRFIGVQKSKIVFAESYCRVKSLSLTGKLLYPFVDRFIVHWPDLTKQYPRAEYHGLIL